MKKFLLITLAALCSAVAVSAQDLAAATETYNNGAMSLQMGDNTAALNAFTEALKMAEACGEEGADVVNNCKDIIPKLELSIGKDLIKEKNFDGAIAQIKKALEVAKKFANLDVETEAKELLPQIAMQKANTLLNAKDFIGATAAYQEIVAADTTNGTAFLRLGQVLSAQGKIADAENAFLKASKNGEEKNALKQLSTMFVKKAASNLKLKKYAEAIADAVKSNEYLENATAMKVAGTAASSLKQNADAVKYLEKYLELSPNAKDATTMRYTIAALAQQLGDKTKAIENYTKILSDPKFAEVAKQQIAALQN